MLISAGFLIGFGVLAAGTANADEDHSSGLLGGLSQVVSPVTGELAPVVDQLAPVVSGVTAVAEPVLKPVTAAVRPLTEPLRPVLDQVAPITDGVTGLVEPLRPVTEPLVAPVVDVARQALPVATPVLQPVTEPPVRQADTPVVPVVPPAPEVLTSARPSAVPAQDAGEVPAVGLPMTAAPVFPWYRGGTPAVPQEMPLVVQGTTTSASAGGLTAPASADLPGSPRTTPYDRGSRPIADGPARGSWCYHYGLSHPS